MDDLPTQEDYEKYAIRNGLFPDSPIPENPEDLVSTCNAWHQHQLLYEQNYGSGHNADTRCYKQPWFHEDCFGVWTGDDDMRCDCGHYWYWDDSGFDPSNIEQFNISCTEPYGRISDC